MSEKEKFEAALVGAIRGAVKAYDDASGSFKEFARVEAAEMGNFKDPETGKRYGYKFIIGPVDFFEAQEPEELDEDENNG